MDLQKVFANSYNEESWKSILQIYFKVNTLAKPENIGDSKNPCYYMGEETSVDGRQIGFFYEPIPDGQTTNRRIGLRNLALKLAKRYALDAAVMAFSDAEHWRVSLVSNIKGFDGISYALTPTRYTFVFGDSKANYKTALERFNILKKTDLNYEKLKEAFSVEALSKEFFDKYREHYTKFVDFVVENADNKKFFGSEFKEWNSKPETQKYLRDYVKKMMGRLVFLHFLQKKGWMGVPASSKDWKNGDKNFIFNLYQNASKEQKNDFLDMVLEPLFFECLNSKRKDDIYDTDVAGIGKVKIPYLNGGLFEKDQLDAPTSKFPKEYFSELLEFFNQYNFTIDENDPNDAEVGVDPEMLGKIFESLLEDNKDKGAFYTPKEIVSYMCKESLVAYLETKFAEKYHKDIRALVEVHEAIGELKDINVQRSVYEELSNVKICDPAIGSGAFPMGLLNELFACKQATSGASNKIIKKDIIQNNIYGVDIEKGAVDIARLRFWLSLVVDSDSPEPLPNLDYKIMQGNSLIESYKGVDLSGLGGGVSSSKNKTLQISLEFDEKFVKQNIQNAMREYFRPQATAEEKVRLREQINGSVRNYIKCFLGASEQKELDKIEMQNDQFFLWHTWFSDVFNPVMKDTGKVSKNQIGFDIVIGNPPYIQLQKNGGVLGNLYKDEGFETFEKTGDIYSLFYEKGVDLLKADAHLCFITSNKWMRAGYGEKTRKFFAKNNPLKLIDFAGVKIFENATVDTNVLLLQKSKNQKETQACTTKDKNCLENLSLYIQQNSVMSEFTKENSWIILSSIESSIKKKIEQKGTPLKDWNIKIYRGVLTGCNDAFIIDSSQRESILAKCKNESERSRTAELIRPILRGRDIRRYSHDWNNLWLINTHNGYKREDGVIVKPIEIDNFPALKQHFDSVAKEIEKKEKKGKGFYNRDDRGVTPYNLRNCAYMEDFSQQKIVWAETMRIHRAENTKHEGFPRFTLVNGDFLLDKTCFFLHGNDAPYEYFLAVMNSKLSKDWIRRNVSVMDNGGFLMQKIYLENLPIPPIGNPEKESICQYMRMLMQTSDEKKRRELEFKIDTAIYKIFDFTPEEIKCIEA